MTKEKLEEFLWRLKRKMWKVRADGSVTIQDIEVFVDSTDGDTHILRCEGPNSFFYVKVDKEGNKVGA